MTNLETQKTRRRLTGTVVSEAMDKTVVVRVERTVMHPKYHKRSVVGKRYSAHDEENAYKVGDTVSIEECRPYSKMKRWRVLPNSKNV